MQSHFNAVNSDVTKAIRTRKHVNIKTDCVSKLKGRKAEWKQNIFVNEISTQRGLIFGQNLTENPQNILKSNQSSE